jgi:hypothetical protein
MPTFPSSPAFRYPVVRRREFDTAIIDADDGTEQRWMRHQGRDSWDLTYPRLTLAERDTLITFWESAHGSADLFDFVFDGVTYTNCYFDGDKFSAPQTSQKWRSVSLRICQVTRLADSGAMPAAFPVLSTGARVQLPYTHDRTFDTVAMQTEGGRYTRSRRGVLRSWTAGGTALTDAEAAAIWDLFGLAQGMYRQFSFTDPDSGVVHTCRFASDVIELRLIAPGHNSLTVGIQEIV